MTLGRRRVVRVPASTANLGPGFDVMAAALALHLELEVRETGAFAVHTDLDVPRDRSNLIVRAFERLHPADGFAFHIASQIPLTGGLGSSAAAIVAGLIAADHLFELDADVRALATELEGHPDNVSAAIDGGFVICAGRRRPPLRAAHGPRGRARHPRHAGAHRAGARRAARRPSPSPTRCSTSPPPSTLTLGLATGSWDLIAAGLRRPAAPAPPGPPLSALGRAPASTPPSTGRWGPRSPARGPPSWCGAATSRRAR